MERVLVWHYVYHEKPTHLAFCLNQDGKQVCWNSRFERWQDMQGCFTDDVEWWCYVPKFDKEV